MEEKIMIVAILLKLKRDGMLPKDGLEISMDVLEDANPARFRFSTRGKNQEIGVFNIVGE